jgi:hypothetical protein
MSNEILPGKLSANRSVSTESPVVMEKTESKKGRGGLSLFLLIVGLGAIALASIATLAPVALYSPIEGPTSIDEARGDMTIAGYSDSNYSTQLNCAIDNLPVYCSGSPVTLSELPPGKHVFSTAESINDQIIVQYFSWEII